MVPSLQPCSVFQNIGQLLAKKNEMNLHGMVYTVAIQQATRQCLTKIKECPHVHVWAGTRTIFFKLNTTVLGDEGGIKISALHAQKHLSKELS